MKTIQCVVLMSLLAACADSTPWRTVPGDDAEVVVVLVLGDGFVRCGGQRMPVEAVVLNLRQKTRAMTHDELQRFVIQLLAEPAPDDPERTARIGADINRLLGEAQIMGVPLARVL